MGNSIALETILLLLLNGLATTSKGDAAVGKSALSQMFSSDGAHFHKNYSMTTGVELHTKCVNISETTDSVELYIIDSAGKEIFQDFCEKMWGQPSVVCVLFDLTSQQSFDSCSQWMDRVRAHCRGMQLPERREVQTTVAQEWAQSQGLDYHETSAKEMENCEAPFHSVARAFHALYQERRETIRNLHIPP
ncbi:intraflagellar transport protein 27 homolog isoform X2 [Gadus morhua]|uniref:intraflagellar transport protein 27 homolog isoform X2 n=1 Tax=Gadus morhua TaxID=8049 RepID=UPI0011B72224|nr:intraflagellar transport protein 27 homolog isoform X2 [Gadus morhua]